MNITILDLYVGESDAAERIVAALGRVRAKIIRMAHPDASLEDIARTKPQGIIISGSNTGRMVVSDPENREVKRHRGYRITRRAVSDAIEKGIPLFGICGGYQLLAQHFGYSIGELEEPEVGWREVRLTKFGKIHPLFQGIPETFQFYQHHKRHVKGIRDDSVLARDGAGAPQAVVFQSQVYGVQFHPEYALEDRTSRSLVLDNFVFYATHRRRPSLGARANTLNFCVFPL